MADASGSARSPLSPTSCSPRRSARPQSLALVVQHPGRCASSGTAPSPTPRSDPVARWQPTPRSSRGAWPRASPTPPSASPSATARSSLDAPAPVAAWRGTEKEAITLLDLLEMRPGLEFVEDYVDDSVSHCIEMLFGSGQGRHGRVRAALPLLHEPGSFWNYSSGTTNIISRILGDAVAGHPWRWRRSWPSALRPGRHDERDPEVRRTRHVRRIVVRLRDRSRLRPLRPVYLDDGVVDGRRCCPRDGASTHARSDRSRRRGTSATDGTGG
jgi:hypothetical protein